MLTKNEPQTIGIIGAMQAEVDALKTHLTGTQAEIISGITFLRGQYGTREVVVAVCGIGKVFAAICAQTMILTYHPDCILNIGVGGGIATGLQIGDVVIAERLVQHDMDTTAFGDPPGLISGLNIVQFPCTPALVDALTQAAEVRGIAHRRGIIASGDCFVSSNEKKRWIAETFGAAVCEMEGASIAQVCYVNQVDFCVLRAISDNGDDGAKQDYAASLAKASGAALDVLETWLQTQTSCQGNDSHQQIDGGVPFDWGRTSTDYAKYRDIYPPAFYEKILAQGLCTAGQSVLDLGTGTGVLPRNLYPYGARWTGVDCSANQIAQAKALSQGLHITYHVMPAEQLDFPSGSFDVISACQCFWYFNPEQTAPQLARLLKSDGRLLLLSMAWLPFEDAIAGASEALVLQYSPNWSGARETMHPISIPAAYDAYFTLTHHEEYRLLVPFTRETWNGRMKACRGIGASLPQAQIDAWEQAHQQLLAEIAPAHFNILHYAAIAVLQKK